MASATASGIPDSPSADANNRRKSCQLHPVTAPPSPPSGCIASTSAALMSKNVSISLPERGAGKTSPDFVAPPLEQPRRFSLIALGLSVGPRAASGLQDFQGQCVK